jgi:hypothetical protein
LEGLSSGNFRVANDSKHIEGVDEPIDEGCTSPAKTAESDEGRRGTSCSWRSSSSVFSQARSRVWETTK